MKIHYDAFIGILSDGELLSLSSTKFASPLGLNVLGTKLKREFPDMLVRIYNLEISDSEIVKNDIKIIINKCERILVSLTLIAGNVLKSLHLAQWFKALGCDLIVGGPEVTDLTIRHFASLSIIDAVCVGFGEHVIVDIIQNGPRQKIYRTPPYFDFGNATVDYSLLFELEKHGGVSILWGGDCHICMERCYFCSRLKRGFGWRNPEIVWNELLYPYQTGIRKLYNTADTVAVNVNQLHGLVTTKPPELVDMKMKCFINATQTNANTAKLLHQLNAWAAVGIESLSRVNVVGKGKTQVADNYRAIRTLAERNVPMILTFVMGLPGETQKSLLSDAVQILNITNQYSKSIYWITVSPLLITLGSRAFDDCEKGNLPKRHPYEFYNPSLLTEQYFKKFCSIKLDEVYKTIAVLKTEINKINPEIIFDSKGLDPQRWN